MPDSCLHLLSMALLVLSGVCFWSALQQLEGFALFTASQGLSAAKLRCCRLARVLV